MKVSKHRVFITITSAILLVLLAFLFAWICFLYWPIIKDEQGVKYTVAEGASIISVAQDLHSLDIIKYPRFFDLLVYIKGNKHELKAGEYLFPKGTTPVSLLKQITTGTGMVYQTFTIIAGWNFKHLRDMLEHETNLQHTITSLSNAEIMARLGQPTLNPEGWFYPDTYYYMKGSSDLALLKRAFHLMQNKLNSVWKQREQGLPYKTQEEVLTVASLVEKETHLEQERPIIAGVIVNRLKKNMLLQIDPTVIYSIGSRYNGIIYKTDLAADNPYNTYVRKGLPPTPIAIPSMGSIQAALHPAHHDYYYFVVKKYNAHAGHQFSATLTEHNQAITAAKQVSSEYFFNENLMRAYFLKHWRAQNAN